MELCRRAFRQGAADFLSKSVDDTELLEAVQRAVRQHLRLRQHQAAGGQARERLARTLELSARTVQTHRASVFDKLEAEPLAEMSRLALEAHGA